MNCNGSLQMKSSHLLFKTPKELPVYLTQLSITQTYEGHHEGNPARISRSIRRDLTAHFRQRMPSINAIVVFEDGQDILPGLQWIAEFGCSQAVRTNDPDYISRLCVCWFTEALPDSLVTALEAALRRADYEINAEDYDPMP